MPTQPVRPVVIAGLLVTVGALAAAVGGTASAEQLYATNGSSLTRFDTLSLATTTTVPLTGLQAGETVVGIDVRPANQQLYGVGSSGRVYVLNPTTGAATPIGAAGAFSLNGTAFGLDINPVPDRIRVVSNTEQSLRLNPNDGSLTGTDTALNPAGNVVAAAYTNNFPGTPTTTLFAIDSAAGQLVRIGGPDGVPSPNGGAVTAVGSLGLGTNLNENIGFDVSGSGTAYATITTAGQSRLYTINTSTGAATLIGTIGSGTTPYGGVAAATAPEPGAALLLAGLATVLTLRRRPNAARAHRRSSREG